MKDKILFVLRGVLITLFALLCFCGLYYFVDVALNHKAGDLFESLFLLEYFNGYREDGTASYAMLFRWERFKTYLLVGCVAVIILCGIITMVCIKRSEKRTRSQVLAQVGELLKSSFSEDATNRFPSEYHDLASSVSELKTELFRKEQALKDEAAKKNDLIAYLAHDLKTPLTSVIGYLSLLQEATDMPAEQRAKYTQITLTKALRLEQLINEFFDITRYNLHEIVLEKGRLDLGYMLTQMTDEFYPLLMEHGNTVTLRQEEDLVIMADADKLARVFNNILKNAIAYSERSSEIIICAQNLDGRVVVTFTNRGKTIPKEKLDRIFEKFYRVDDARSMNSGGAGLGLAIAKQIVHLHGGEIGAQSENTFTTFRVELPT